MSAILPAVNLDSASSLSQHLLPYQVNWCIAEEALHAQGRRAFALAEKSVRIGFTWADAFKNVRKRILFKNRDYLFVTKDYQSALEYMRAALQVASLFDYTRAIVSHGEDYVKVNRLDDQGHPTAFTDEVKIGYIKFDNGSRILAFSSSPQAMAVYGGDVGLDEFAKHPQAERLWETAMGRITWGYDLAVWSAHDGEDTLFNQFAQEARAGKGPWNLYYRITIEDAIELGLLDTINRLQDTHFRPKEFLEDCLAQARNKAVFEQAYMCNPMGASSDAIVEWSVIQRNRFDYPIERWHLEAEQVAELFGEYRPQSAARREQQILEHLRRHFPRLFGFSSFAPSDGERAGVRGSLSSSSSSSCSSSLSPSDGERAGVRGIPNSQLSTKHPQLRLGFDVAGSGQGHLTVIYIDEVIGNDFWLRGLFTCRTEDWHFVAAVLARFLSELTYVQGAGDGNGLGQHICWDMEHLFPSRFTPVNFTSKKHELGFALMNQLSLAQKRLPASHEDIAADFYALRKSFVGKRWVFSEGRNLHNPASHCDIAWAGALATEAHNCRKNTIGARLG